MVDKTKIHKIRERDYPFIYKGRKVRQHISIVDFFEGFERRPGFIVEIGTAEGGLTKIIEDSDFSKYAEIWTFDPIRCSPMGFSGRVKFFGDFFDHIKQLKNKLQEPAHAFVFCDGGNKSLEFKILNPLLKKRDIIFVHDFTLKQGKPANHHWQNIECRAEDLNLNTNEFYVHEHSKVGWGEFVRL